MKVIRLFILLISILLSQTVFSQDEFYEKERLEDSVFLSLRKKGFCLKGEVLSCFKELDTVFVFGDHLIFHDCTFENRYPTFLLDYFVNISFEKYHYELNYYKSYYNPSNSKYDIFTKFCKIKVDLDEESAIEKEYFYNGYVLNKKELQKIHSQIDKCLKNIDTLVSFVHEYGFMDMVFYGAMMGDEKCQYFFENAYYIAMQGNQADIGGEPWNIYARLIKIYNLFRENNIIKYKMFLK